MDRVAERIFKLVDKQFPEQKAFAQALGETPAKVSQWRTGQTKSYQKRLHKIADILGTSVDYLLTGEKKELATLPDDELDLEVLSLIKRIPPERMEEVKRFLRFQQGSGEEKQ